MNLFTMRIGLLLSAVVGVGAIAALSIGASFSLFSATSPGVSQTFMAGTVTLGTPGTVTCNVGNLEPGDTGTCNFQANYTGSLPAYIGVEATVAGYLGNELTITYNSGPVTDTTPVLVGNSVANGNSFWVPLSYALNPGANNSYQGATATMTVTFYAVQCSHNGTSGDLNDNCAEAPASWGGTTLYDSLVSPLPGSIPSLGFDATNATELGNEINLASSAPLRTVVVTMDSWACHTGSWDESSGVCTTTPGSTYPVEITFTIYNPIGMAVLGTDTQSFDIPFRPSASASCGNGEWQASDGCHNGLATNLTFSFSSPVTLPGTVVYGIAFATPNDTPQDSLNVALSTEPTNVSVGSDAVPATAFVATGPGSNDVGGPNGEVTCTPIGSNAPFAQYSTAGTSCGLGTSYNIPAVEFMAS